jgi:hypothetical protein
VEEDTFGLGPPDPLWGLGLGVATATTEKDVGTSGLTGGGAPKTNLSVSFVLLSPQNERYYCCSLICRDRICLNKSHLCDV